MPRSAPPTPPLRPSSSGRCRELEARVEALEPDRGAAARAPAVEAAAASASGSQPRGGLAGAGAGIVIAVLGAITGMTAVIGLGAVVAAAAGVWAFTARRGGGSRELDRLLPGGGPVAERLAAFRSSVERDHALAGTERELAATRLQAAEVRTRLAGSIQLEAELAGLRDRVATALRTCEIDPADLDEGLRSYDRIACCGHRPHRGHSHPHPGGRGAAPAARRRLDRGGPRPPGIAARGA